MITAAFRAPWLLTAARAFAAGGFPLYAVGGSVRNALMGLPASDIDVCGPATPDQVVALCAGTAVRAVLRVAHFGTVELHVTDADGRHMAEYTTFRMDSYRCGHQPSAVSFATTPQVDALRRDFSVNALYLRLTDTPDAPEALIDPTGGLAHIRQRVLHTVTVDPDQVLKDDGLRILRAARFQAELGLTPTPALLASATRYAPLLKDIAQERLRDELIKLLLSDARYPTLTRSQPPVPAGLDTLLQVGAWGALFGTLQANDTAIRATACYLPPEGMPPIAGKLTVLFWQESPQALGDCMRRLRISQREAAATETSLKAMHGIRQGSLSLMDAVRLGLPALRQAAAAFTALHAAGEPLSMACKQADAMLAALQSGIPRSLQALALSGDDLLPLCTARNLPARQIGWVLDTLWQAAVEQRVKNEKTALLALAEKLLNEMKPD